MGTVVLKIVREMEETYVDRGKDHTTVNENNKSIIFKLFTLNAWDPNLDHFLICITRSNLFFPHPPKKEKKS